jgi:hypothetical protein
MRRPAVTPRCRARRAHVSSGPAMPGGAFSSTHAQTCALGRIVDVRSTDRATATLTRYFRAPPREVCTSELRTAHPHRRATLRLRTLRHPLYGEFQPAPPPPQPAYVSAPPAFLRGPTSLLQTACSS